MLIKIHSIVDVITNSSSVTYTLANEKTIETIKELITNLLELTDSSYHVDDLFTFELENEDLDENIHEICGNIINDQYHLPEKYSYTYLREKGYFTDRAELCTLLYNTYKEIGIPEEIVEEANNQDGYNNISIKVTPKQGGKENKRIAKILSNLQNLFNYESRYDG